MDNSIYKLKYRLNTKNARQFFLTSLTGLILLASHFAFSAPYSATSKSAVLKALKVTKSFNPNSIKANQFSTLSISFINNNSDPANLTAPFNEKLPTGMYIIGSASSDCGGTLVATPGGDRISLTNAKIPAFSSCQILLGVSSAQTGVFQSKTLASALQTDKGSNSASNEITLTVRKVGY
jgi:hypothetical protein